MPKTLAPEDVNPVDAAIAEYFDAIDAGEALSAEGLDLRHEGLRDELRVL